MNRPATFVLATALGLMAATALALHWQRQHQRLGPPGVKTVEGRLLDTAGNVAATNLVYLPERVLSMTSTQMPVTQVELDWLPRDTTFGRRRYVEAAGTNGVFCDISVVLMGTDRTSIHQPQYCLTGQGFTIDRTDRMTIPMQRPHPYELPVLRLTASYRQQDKHGGERLWRGVYVYWFVADGELTAAHGARMWRMARDMVLTGVLQRWAYVSYFTVCAPGQEEAAYERIKAMIQASVPEFQLVPRGGRVAEISQPDH